MFGGGSVIVALRTLIWGAREIRSSQNTVLSIALARAHVFSTCLAGCYRLALKNGSGPRSRSHGPRGKCIRDAREVGNVDRTPWTQGNPKGFGQPAAGAVALQAQSSWRRTPAHEARNASRLSISTGTMIGRGPA